MSMDTNPNIEQFHLIHLQFTIRVEKLTDENLIILKDIAEQIKKMFNLVNEKTVLKE